LKCAHDSAHVAPPLNDVDATSPCAPPFDHRSCWKTPTRWSGFVGSTATRGSTSAFSNSVPDCGTTSQPGGNGLGCEATDGGVAMNGPELAVPTTRAVARKTTAITALFMNTPFTRGSKTDSPSLTAGLSDTGGQSVAGERDHDVVGAHDGGPPVCGDAQPSVRRDHEQRHLARPVLAVVDAVHSSAHDPRARGELPVELGER